MELLNIILIVVFTVVFIIKINNLKIEGKGLVIKAIIVLSIISCSFKPLLQAQGTMQVKGRFLYDPQGEKVVLRGINEMFIWSSDLTGEKTFPEIAKTGANVVRLVWLSHEENPKGNAANLDAIITNCINQGLIPMPELHGATGKWQNLQKQVDYWTNPEVVKVLKKHQEYLLLNIANEVGASEVTDEQFRAAYEDAVSRIRKTGVNCPLIIDGTGWGQNIDILQANGPYLLAKDPKKNLMFSVHMWWTAPDGAKDRIINELEESVKMELPLLVGEFAPMGVGCKKYIDYRTIMEQCQKHQIGWLAWSWGLQNNGDCGLMDMTSDAQPGKFAGLTDWGLEVAVTDKYSIKNTAKKTRYLKRLAAKANNSTGN